MLYGSVAGTITRWWRTSGNAVSIAVTVPAQAAGSVARTVYDQYGGSASAGAVTYVAAPSISYTSPVTDTIGKAASHAMTNSGGTTDSVKAITALPAGLSCDKTTGLISGTPTTATAGAAYTIRAYNLGGTSDFAITITVVAQIVSTGRQSKRILLFYHP